MTSPRRGFLRTLSLGLGAIVAAPKLLSATPANHGDGSASELWLKGLSGEHKQFFDVAVHGSGNPLLRAATFLNAYGNAYGLADSDVNVIFGAHGTGLALVLDDKTWSQYMLGAHYGVQDPATKAPAVRNIYSGVGSASSIEHSLADLQKRGVRFLGCMQTVARLSHALAARTGEPQSAVSAALLAGFLPGVTAVPAMIVAVNRAQESGLTYVHVG